MDVQQMVSRVNKLIALQNVRIGIGLPNVIQNLDWKQVIANLFEKILNKAWSVKVEASFRRLIYSDDANSIMIIRISDYIRNIWLNLFGKNKAFKKLMHCAREWNKKISEKAWEVRWGCIPLNFFRGSVRYSLCVCFMQNYQLSSKSRIIICFLDTVL